MKNFQQLFALGLCLFCTMACTNKTRQAGSEPKANLIATDTFFFNSFVDCNMATVWVKDTFRIFPGKYGEDPLWGESHELKFASGKTVNEVFGQPSTAFTEPAMPVNVPAGTPGLHGAVWFEALYKDPKDTNHLTGRLFPERLKRRGGLAGHLKQKGRRGRIVFYTLFSPQL